MKAILLIYLFSAPVLAAAVQPRAYNVLPANRADNPVAEIQKKLGDSYRARLDEQRRIAVLSDLPDSAVDGYLDTLRQNQIASPAG